MAEVKEGYTVIYNPYVVRMDKFAKSLEHLTDRFLSLEATDKSFGQGEMEEIYSAVKENVCSQCEYKETCSENKDVYMHQMVYEIMSAVEEYGVELNMETKRRLQKHCVQAPRFLRETLERFQDAKQVLVWNHRIAEEREGCARQLDTFAKMVMDAARELEASIFEDEHLEKKIKNQFRKIGLRILSTVFFVTEDGRYEIHLTLKSAKNLCITTKEMLRVLSKCVGRNMVAGNAQRPVVGYDYATVICVEGPCYYTLQGVAKIGKGCEKVSGDSFLMMKLPGGKEGAVLSDGMGSGEKVSKESAMVVEMLEELLDAGFPKETAVEMMNTALVMGREDICFSTLDMSVFDLYNGTYESMKVGASTTYIKRGEKVEKIVSESLPLGVVRKLEPACTVRQLEHGDFVIMITDGVLDAFPYQEQDVLMDMIVKGCAFLNPKEIAKYILEQVLEFTGEAPLDDMTVLVVGIWKI